jgi:long-chain acyl-CoA synthetase
MTVVSRAVASEALAAVLEHRGGAAADSLAAAVDRLLRCEGRSPAVDPAAVLSLRERALLAVLGPTPLRAGAAPVATDGACCHLGRLDHGRPLLSLEPRPGVEPLGFVEVRREELAAIEVARAELAREASAADAEVDALCDALSDAEHAALVRRVIDVVDHNDPVQVYVDDALFSHVDRANNLLAKPGQAPDDRYILHRLERAPRTALSRAERRFLGVMWLLGRADLRLEELNGRQCTPWALAAFFAQKHAEPWPDGLEARAACLARRKRRLRETHVVYRWIDGLTLRKEERWYPRPPAARELPAAVARHCQERFGLTCGPGGHDAFFLEVARRIARQGDGAARSAELERLLEVVVRAAMHEVPSPIAMTRGMRDLRHFQDAVEAGRVAEVCATPLDDGYCAVFARDDLHLYDPQPLARILTAISRRMMFNHRHYLPGHFDDAQAPDRPHFYYPPTMADIAEHGEHRHPGHTMVRARHSLRSPAPLVIAGRSWPGLVDIRMMRAVGHPYSEADLVAVGRYTEIVRSIAQALLALKGEGLRAPVVTGFDRPYYERRHGHAAVIGAGAPASRPAGPALGAMLREAMARHGAGGAIVDAVTGRRFALAEVEAVARRLFAAAGGRPGARVAVACGDRAHQALLVTAGLAAGLVVCPLDHAMRPRLLAGLLGHVAADLVLTDAGPLLAAGVSEQARPAGASGGLVIYTSGATGTPKGVLLDEHQLGANVAFARDHFGYAAGAPWTSACLLPLHHTFAIVSDLLPVLCAGGRVVVLPRFDAADAGAVAETFARHAVRSYSAVPIMIEALLALGVPLPASLAFAITGAAPLAERSRARYRERHGHPVVPCYGLTESVCFATASPVGGGRPGSAGRAAGIDIRVVGEDLQPLGAGEPGEIALRGASVVSGYFGRAPDDADPAFEDGWFLTGDMGRLDEDGYLYITGRRKHMLIRGGEKLYLEDLDRCLEEHGAVAEACSVQVRGLFGYERAVAFLVSRGGRGGAAVDDAIRAHVRDRMGPIGVPDELRWTDRIPRSATGKPLRAALRARLAEVG